MHYNGQSSFKILILQRGHSGFHLTYFKQSYLMVKMCVKHFPVHEYTVSSRCGNKALPSFKPPSCQLILQWCIHILIKYSNHLTHSRSGASGAPMQFPASQLILQTWWHHPLAPEMVSWTRKQIKSALTHTMFLCLIRLLSLKMLTVNSFGLILPNEEILSQYNWNLKSSLKHLYSILMCLAEPAFTHKVQNVHF